MNFKFISGTELFRGCTEKEISVMAEYMHFRTERYGKGTVILGEGSIVSDIGLVMSGSVQIEHMDIWGNKSILGMIHAGGVFAEAYACLPHEPMMVEVTANEMCEILWISVPRLFGAGTECPGRSQVLQNLVVISAGKNLQLSGRSLHTSPKTIRQRVLSYLSEQVSLQGSSKVTIPFDRQQMADYLNVDRSALSKELGKMKRDGLLDYYKNSFEIKL